MRADRSAPGARGLRGTLLLHTPGQLLYRDVSHGRRASAPRSGMAPRHQRPAAHAKTHAILDEFEFVEEIPERRGDTGASSELEPSASSPGGSLARCRGRLAA